MLNSHLDYDGGEDRFWCRRVLHECDGDTRARQIAVKRAAYTPAMWKFRVERRSLDRGRTSLLQRSGPTLVSLSLGGLIVAELARLSLALIGPIGSHAPESAAISRSPRSGHDRVDVPGIVAAHLFGGAMQSKSQDPENAPLATGSLVLAGTIARQDPRRGMAIISDAGPSKLYAVGDMVGDASLYSVYLNRVILSRNGSFGALALPRVLVETSGSARSPPHPSNASATAETSQQDTSGLAGIMRVGASVDNQAGKLRGFKVFPGTNRPAFLHSGLRGGDLVTAINGTSLESQERRTAKEAFDTIKAATYATLTVERDGESQDIMIDATRMRSDVSAASVDAPASAEPPQAGTEIAN